MQLDPPNDSAKNDSRWDIEGDKDKHIDSSNEYRSNINDNKDLRNAGYFAGSDKNQIPSNNHHPVVMKQVKH